MNINISELLSQLRTAAIVIESLPERPGYNGSILIIDDTEAGEISKSINAAVEALQEFTCIGVIDSEGGIYPEPPEPVTQVFVKSPSITNSASNN